MRRVVAVLVETERAREEEGRLRRMHCTQMELRVPRATVDLRIYILSIVKSVQGRGDGR